MHEQQIWDTLLATFRQVLDDEELVVRPETTAKEVPEWDSLAHIQLLVALEEAFEVRFNTGEVASLKNVGEMVSLIGGKLSRRPAPRMV